MRRFIWPDYSTVKFECNIYIEDDVLTPKEERFARIEIGKRVMGEMGLNVESFVSCGV